jgi:hypothetical protein
LLINDGLKRVRKPPVAVTARNNDRSQVLSIAP